VTLPPGRLRLATRPSWTGSEPTSKTIGMVVVGYLAAGGAPSGAGGDAGTAVDMGAGAEGAADATAEFA
jgi:hypothetical protein